MARYNRVNLDGKSYYETQTATSAAALLPGTFVELVDGKFVQLAAAKANAFVVGNGEHQGLGITDAIPAGDSVVGNKISDARVFAIRVAAGAYKDGTAIGVSAAGTGEAVVTGDVIGFSLEDVTITAEDPFLRVRIRAGLAE